MPARGVERGFVTLPARRWRQRYRVRAKARVGALPLRSASTFAALMVAMPSCAYTGWGYALHRAQHVMPLFAHIRGGCHWPPGVLERVRERGQSWRARDRRMGQDRKE